MQVCKHQDSAFKKKRKEKEKQRLFICQLSSMQKKEEEEGKHHLMTQKYFLTTSFAVASSRSPLGTQSRTSFFWQATEACNRACKQHDIERLYLAKNLKSTNDVLTKQQLNAVLNVYLAW